MTTRLPTPLGTREASVTATHMGPIVMATLFTEVRVTMAMEVRVAMVTDIMIAMTMDVTAKKATVILSQLTFVTLTATKDNQATLMGMVTTTITDTHLGPLRATTINLVTIDSNTNEL